jgi:hypothetical protein
MTLSPRWQLLNQVALVAAGAILVALGLTWWRDRSQKVADPRWEPARFAMLEPESPALAGSNTERWLVAVSLDCPHCQEHLRALGRRIAGRAAKPALAALIVDHTTRPENIDLGVPLEGGAWWDSAQVWREKWGRRMYGETFRFDRSGRLLSSTPAGVVPDSSSSPM